MELNDGKYEDDEFKGQEDMAKEESLIEKLNAGAKNTTNDGSPGTTLREWELSGEPA